jgi:hypothetical protein
MMVRGGFRPEAQQNNPFSVSGTGGNGQSGKFVAEKAAKASQLRMSGLPQGQNTAISQQISEGGNVASTANAANPASKLPSGGSIADILGAIEPLDSEPQEFLPITDGIDGYSGRGREALPGSIRNPIQQNQNLEIIRKYLPDIINATRLPGVPDSYRRFANFLKEQIL